MTYKSLIYIVNKSEKLPRYLKREVIKVLKSPLYVDLATIISTLDQSPRSVECTKQFKQLNPLAIRNLEDLFEFKKQLRQIREDALKCTINPYFFKSTKTNNHVQTLGDIIVPNSNIPVTIDRVIVSSRYNHLDKVRMVKDYLIKWNREAKEYLKERIKENREYLDKSHRVNCHSKLLSIGAIISFVAAIVAGYKFFTTTITEQNALYYLLVFVGFGLVSITNSVVNSFHSRKLRSYDAQMEKLDDLYHKYVDHTFDIEAYALRKVEKRHLCSLPLKKINIISSSIDKFDILDYSLSERYTSNRKYWFLKLLAFIGFVASIVSLILILL